MVGSAILIPTVLMSRVVVAAQDMLNKAFSPYGDVTKVIIMPAKENNGGASACPPAF